MTNYKQLCAELVDELEGWIAYGDEIDIANAHVLIDRARVALTEPEPEVPTDQELNDTYWKAWHEHFDRTNSVLHAVGLRAVLARWGNHPTYPDSSTQVQ